MFRKREKFKPAFPQETGVVTWEVRVENEESKRYLASGLKLRLLKEIRFFLVCKGTTELKGTSELNTPRSRNNAFLLNAISILNVSSTKKIQEMLGKCLFSGQQQRKYKRFWSISHLSERPGMTCGAYGNQLERMVSDHILNQSSQNNRPWIFMCHVVRGEKSVIQNNKVS